MRPHRCSRRLCFRIAPIWVGVPGTWPAPSTAGRWSCRRHAGRLRTKLIREMRKHHPWHFHG
jgi:hypothetical protein